MKYVALLRGINVGGNSMVKMADLKVAFEAMSLQHVATFINSGNVLFESKNIPQVSNLEKTLSKRFNLELKLVVRSHSQLKKILDKVPSDWKRKKDLRCYIAFVREPISAEEVIKESNPREGVDSVQKGDGVVYMTTKLSGITKSGFTKLATKKIYKDITIRNYNTTQKLLALMEQE